MGPHALLLVPALIATANACSVNSTQAANWLEKNFWLSGPRYDHDVPLCDERGPLDEIATGFGVKESQYWKSSLKIVAFENIREIAWEPWSAGTIPRRYCTASAVVSDGKKHALSYSIIEDGGMSGAGYGVEWCVAGLDRNWAYNPACRAARP
jgi:hypothetical protein